MKYFFTILRGTLNSFPLKRKKKHHAEENVDMLSQTSVQSTKKYIYIYLGFRAAYSLTL